MRLYQLSESKAEDWLEQYTLNPLNKWPSREVIDDLLRRYPIDSELVLYRGMNFSSKEDYDQFTSSISSGTLEAGSITSWSRSREEALAFAVSRPTYFINNTLMSDMQAAKEDNEELIGYRGVMLATKIKHGQGIDVSKSPFSKEDEVILLPGSYKVVFKDIKKFKEIMDEDDIDKVVKQVAINDEVSDSYLSKFASYVINNHPDKLSTDTITGLIDKYGGINLDPKNVSLVPIEDEYYDKKLMIKFNPWLFKFYDLGLLPSDTERQILQKGKLLLKQVTKIVSQNGSVLLSASGIEQLSKIVDNGTSYDRMVAMVSKNYHDTATKASTDHINQMTQTDKKTAIQQEKERIVALLKGIE